MTYFINIDSTIFNSCCISMIMRNDVIILLIGVDSCGQVQTGSFLDIAAPNGLFGLGLDKVSVPSTLFRKGYIENSFSMCFGKDGTGRINFGDKGSLDQEEAPFNMNLFQ